MNQHDEGVRSSESQHFVQKITELFVSPEKDDRHNNINIIRFIAAAMVIYGHMSHLIGAPMPQLFGQEISSIAVKVFFVLSGYLIAQSLMRDNHTFRYFVRRTFRIFPGLFFVCFIAAFVLGPLLSSEGFRSYFSSSLPYEYFIKNSLMNPVYSLPGVFENNLYPNAVNGSLWTLPVEFSMYILLPISVFVFKKLNILKPGLAIMAVGLVALSVAHMLLFPSAVWAIWGSNVWDGLVLTPYFFMGAVFSFPEFKKIFNLQWAIVLAFVAGVIVLDGYWQYEIVVFLTLPYITLSCSLATPAVFGRVFAVNDYSYGLYLWGFFVQQILVSFIGVDKGISIVAYSAICFIVATVCAMVSWHLVEKPCNGVGKKVCAWSRRREAERLAKKTVTGTTAD